MKTVLAHFYFASAAATAAGQAAWHVAVLDVAETMDEVAALGGATRERTLNVTQAAEAGVTLESVADLFNADAAAAAEALGAELAQLSDLMSQQGAALEKARARIMVLEAERATDAAPVA